jgi:pimeloyl-ACP methyl ester carboxylesterase
MRYRVAVPKTDHYGVKARSTLALLLVAAALTACGGLAGNEDPPRAALRALGGERCPGSDFTCVTIEMPLDHFTEGDPRTIGVTFAVLPATGERRGAFVTAVGGPGSSGIEIADYAADLLDERIRESYDLVYFDQRGVGRSGNLECPKAYARQEPWAYENDLAVATANVSSYVTECLSELADPEILAYVGTRQVAADLERFREAVGYETLVLLGESYGTEVAQTYAAAYPDRVERMVLDGTVDLTLDTLTYLSDRARAFDQAFGDMLASCDRDQVCSTDMGGAALEVFDRLVQDLTSAPIPVSYGTGLLSDVYDFNLVDLRAMTGQVLYTQDDRVAFLRALAEHRRSGTLQPLLAMAWAEVYDDLGDPNGDLMFDAVHCADRAYPGGTTEARAAAVWEAAQEANSPLFDDVIREGLICAVWPYGPADAVRPGPLGAPIPTLVVASTHDAATPYWHGASVAERLLDGHLLTVHGPTHVIFGRGNGCVDGAVTEFILSGRFPPYQTCREDVAEYTPLMPSTMAEYDTVEDLLWAIDYEVWTFPELSTWDGSSRKTVDCTHGGTVELSGKNEVYRFRYEQCGLTPEIVVTGTSVYEWALNTTEIDVRVGDAGCRFALEGNYDSARVTNSCPGGPF